MAARTTVTSAAEALSHPLVVWAAWLRVDQWYRSGNLAPQPELSQWQLHPEAEARKLAGEIRSGQWRPSTWKQLPCPKRGACLRHYVMPTVKDQVAFMAYLVLLGPLLDSRFLSFVFGNRLYRPLAWDSRSSFPHWRQRGYPFLTPHTYLPYRRSHGLFRRVASWTVSSMTGAPIQEENYAGRVQRPADYDYVSLPRWTHKRWWGTNTDNGKANRRAYWASLDVQLAYPSVKLTSLSKALVDLVEPLDSATDPLDIDITAAHIVSSLDGYPRALVEGLADKGLRKTLAQGLIKALDRVKVDCGEIPTSSWTPHHARAILPPENKGLPTGLAISGLLLNVVLHRVDSMALEYLQDAHGQFRGAVVRFADDMYLMARSPEGIFRLIDVVWGAIEGHRDDLPIRPKSRSNLYVNLSKVDPTAVGDVVRKCLGDSGWEACGQCSDLLPGKRASLYRWWLDGADEGLRRSIDRESIGPGDVGPFVTTLVERLSDIGSDMLVDRFGQAAKDRQVQLHDLARFDIEDEQVRPDTRRTFAANRLAGTWLSADQDEARREISEIRRSIATVFEQTPWKVALWGAVVRAAARRTAGDKSDFAKDDADAEQWLTRLLRHVATQGEESWLRNWPEKSAESSHNGSVDWRNPYLSYHRTAFWQSLAKVIRLLKSHHDKQARDDLRGAGASPRHWATRAVPEGRHGDVAGFLGDIDRWAGVLYGTDPTPADLPRWELDHFAAACLATATGRTVAESWRRCDQRVRRVVVPEGVVADTTVVRVMLARNGRLAPERKSQHPLGRLAVAQLLLTGGGRDFDGVLFADRRPSGVKGADADAYEIAVACSLHCEHLLADETVLRATSKMANDPLALQEYDRARRVFLGRGLPWPP